MRADDRSGWAGAGLALGLILAVPAGADVSRLSDEPVPSVGVVRRIDGLILPGTELEPKPVDDRLTRVIVRVVESYKHGTSWRYDLSYYGLEPGRSDLKDYLKRKDNTGAADLPPIPVEFVALRPPGQVEPNALKPTGSTLRSRYRAWMFAGAVAWFVGLVAIIFAGRRRAKVAEAAEAKPVTLADRLRPLVDRARAGTLEPAERADLERTLIDYWRRRLGRTALAPGKAIALIRADEQAGALLRAREGWLHRPPGDGARDDVAALLEPYRALPEAVPAGTTVGGAAR